MSLMDLVGSGRCSGRSCTAKYYGVRRSSLGSDELLYHIERKRAIDVVAAPSSRSTLYALSSTWTNAIGGSSSGFIHPSPSPDTAKLRRRRMGPTDTLRAVTLFKLRSESADRPTPGRDTERPSRFAYPGRRYH